MTLAWLALLSCQCGPSGPAGPGAPVEVTPTAETGGSSPVSTGSTATTGHTGVGLRRSFHVEASPYLYIEPERTGEEAFGLGSRVVFWDADVDGDVELLVSSKGNTYLFDVPDHPGEVLTWRDALHAFHGQGASGICRADMDGDGDDDIVLYQEGIGNSSQLWVHLAPFDAASAISAPIEENTGSFISCADMTGDAIGDVLIYATPLHGFRMYSGPFVANEVHPADGSLVRSRLESVGVHAVWPDVTGDGRPDLWYEIQNKAQYVSRGTLQAGVEGQQERKFPLSEWSGLSVVIPNGLGTGEPAVAMASQRNPDNVAIVRTPLSRATIEEVVAFPRFDLFLRGTLQLPLWGGDVDGDGIGDLVMLNSSHETCLLLGPFDGSSSPSSQVVLSWYQEWDSIGGPVDFHDIDGDGVRDVAIGGAEWGIAVHLVGPQLEEARQAAAAGVGP